MSKRNYIVAGLAVIALALGVWWLAGSGTAPEPAPSSPEAGKAAPGVLPVDRTQAAQLGIRLAPAVTASEAPDRRHSGGDPAARQCARGRGRDLSRRGHADAGG